MTSVRLIPSQLPPNSTSNVRFTFTFQIYIGIKPRYPLLASVAEFVLLEGRIDVLLIY